LASIKSDKRVSLVVRIKRVVLDALTEAGRRSASLLSDIASQNVHARHRGRRAWR